jgi:hypothetical protein
MTFCDVITLRDDAFFTLFHVISLTSHNLIDQLAHILIDDIDLRLYDLKLILNYNFLGICFLAIRGFTLSYLIVYNRLEAKDLSIDAFVIVVFHYFQSLNHKDLGEINVVQ